MNKEQAINQLNNIKETLQEDYIFADRCIEALDIAIESLDNEWVDVRDRLPINDFLNLSKDVLICNAEGEMFVAYYDYKKQCWRNQSKVFSWSDNIIAWKPLPKPYERKKLDYE